MKISNINWKSVFILITLIIYFFPDSGLTQIQATDKRYIRVGSLQSHISAYGSERAWNNSYYEGLRWPAEYLYQDNAVIKRFWIGCNNYTDVDNNYWEAFGFSFAADYVGISLFPVELKQTAKFESPVVYVDGNNITAPYSGDVDQVDPTIISDRIVNNVVNTLMGITYTRRVYAFSQPYHDNYFIIENTFTNTGNVDYDAEIERNAPVYGFRVGWGTRYSVCREGSFVIHSHQSWGKHSWCTRRGENYADHYGEIITGDTPIADWIRCAFQWVGQFAENSYDNIGGPDIFVDGRLTAPHHTGVAVLHVDKTATDKNDDPNQPVVMGWHAGDTYPGISTISKGELKKMIDLYAMLSGVPYGSGMGGNERYDEKYLISNPDPWTVHNDGGGTNLWVAYGPFDLELGESVTIVEAEGVAGLSRSMCETIGRRWFKAYKDPNDKGPFTLPNGSTTTDKNVYKNSWVYTGKDSIMLTFSRAKRNYDSNYQIPQSPLPPSAFQVTSGGDRITLTWTASSSEKEPDFGGYKIFRAVGKSDTVFYEIFACGKGTSNPKIVYSYDDLGAIRGFSYYYYIAAFNDGSLNNTNANPHGPLYSSKYYTSTTAPAYLKRPPGSGLSNIRIVPNPYYIRSNLQYPEEPDKIMFYNIPGQCTIKIYTERGDLIKTIEHTDGSGDHAWNSVTDSRQVVVSGLYLAYIEIPQGEHIIKKLIIIR